MDSIKILVNKTNINNCTTKIPFTGIKRINGIRYECYGRRDKIYCDTYVYKNEIKYNNIQIEIVIVEKTSEKSFGYLHIKLNEIKMKIHIWFEKTKRTQNI